MAALATCPEVRRRYTVGENWQRIESLGSNVAEIQRRCVPGRYFAFFLIAGKWIINLKLKGLTLGQGRP